MQKTLYPASTALSAGNAMQTLVRVPAMAGITHRTLTQQLRELERNRLIRRKVYPEVPPKVEYSLTPLGESLHPVLIAMHEWGKSYTQKGTKGR